MSAPKKGDLSPTEKELFQVITAGTLNPSANANIEISYTGSCNLCQSDHCYANVGYIRFVLISDSYTT